MASCPRYVGLTGALFAIGLYRPARRVVVAGMIGLTGMACKGSPSSPGPVVSAVSAFPNVGLQGATTITYLYSGETSGTTSGSDARALWDFGDGATATVVVATSAASAASPPGFATHVYNTAGTFTVRVTVTDSANKSASNQTTVTVKSMSGRWTLGTTSGSYDLTQTGTVIAGTFNAPATARTVSGTVKAASPIVTFTDSIGLTFSGDPSADINTVTGVLNGGGLQNQPAGITRQ
jgi:PKD domain-containing protein